MQDATPSTTLAAFPERGQASIFTGVTRASICPKEYIERGQIYFGFEVDEKLLPFAVEEFGDQCWVYGSDIPHGNRLYGAVDVFLKRNDISEESKQKLLVDNTARFYGV
jgi:predicted TIM-barrel fold metal-dependent hydrolase